MASASLPIPSHLPDSGAQLKYVVLTAHDFRKHLQMAEGAYVYFTNGDQSLVIFGQDLSNGCLATTIASAATTPSLLAELEEMVANILVSNQETFVEDGEESEIGRRATLMIRRYGEDLLAHLNEILSQTEAPEWTKALFVEQVGLIKDDASRQSRASYLVETLRDTSPLIRYTAVRGLAAMKYRPSEPLLRKMLREEPSQLVVEAIESALQILS